MVGEWDSPQERRSRPSAIEFDHYFLIRLLELAKHYREFKVYIVIKKSVGMSIFDSVGCGLGLGNLFGYPKLEWERRRRYSKIWWANGLPLNSGGAAPPLLNSTDC